MNENTVSDTIGNDNVIDDTNVKTINNVYNLTDAFIRYDVDSYAIVGIDLCVFKKMPRITLLFDKMRFVPCENKKITLQLLKTGESLSKVFFVEFRLCNYGDEQITCLMKLSKSFSNINYAFHFFSEVIIPAIKEIPSNSRTRAEFPDNVDARSLKTVHIYEVDLE